MGKPESFRTYLAYTKPAAHQKVLRKTKACNATIVREPRNPHDANACAVHIRGRMVGYVPAEIAATLAPIIDAGEWTYIVSYLAPREYDGVMYANLSIEPRRPTVTTSGSKWTNRKKWAKSVLMAVVAVASLIACWFFFSGGI